MPPEPSNVQPIYNREGEVIGTRIHHGAKVYELPQYPHRIRAIETRPSGLVVHFKPGHARLLEEDDAR